MIQPKPEPPDLTRHRRGKASQAIDLTKLDRLPPHSIEAEQSILGCCFLTPTEALPVCIEHFPNGVETFYDLRHQTIYDALLAMFELRLPVDLITVQQRLKDKNQLDAVGGIAYLAALLDAVPSAANLSYYLDIVREKALRRRMIQVGSSVATQAYEEAGNAEELLDQCESDVLAIRQQRQQKGSKGIKTLVHEVINEIEECHRNQGQLFGMSTGFIDLDKATNGLANGDMVILAGRPSTGKTSLAMCIAENVGVTQGLPVGIFSLEMTARSLVRRMVSSRARVSLRDLARGELTEGDVEKLTTSSVRISRAPLFIDDARGLSVLQLRARARRMWQQHGIKLLVIDYIQLLTSTNKKCRSREEELADISMGAKALAGELGIPVLVLSQLNRDLEKEKKKRPPRLSDLRGSGSLEQDGDVIGLLSEDESEEEISSDCGIPVTLGLAKQRNGERDVPVHLTFLRQYTRFESQSRVYSEGWGK